MKCCIFADTGVDEQSWMVALEGESWGEKASEGHPGALNRF
jgi:hypothetical protein